MDRSRWSRTVVVAAAGVLLAMACGRSNEVITQHRFDLTGNGAIAVVPVVAALRSGSSGGLHPVEASIVQFSPDGSAMYVAFTMGSSSLLDTAETMTVTAGALAVDLRARTECFLFCTLDAKYAAVRIELVPPVNVEQPPTVVDTTTRRALRLDAYRSDTSSVQLSGT
jgi:hypothetical protein